MKNTLEIKTKLRFRDAFRYNLHIAFNSIVNYIFLIIGIISLGMFINNMVTLDTTMDVRFSQSFILLIPPFLFFVNVPVKVWKATTALLSNPILKEEVIYIFSAEKIAFQTSQGEDDITWDYYMRIVETNKDFRLFMDKAQAQIIPKYALDDQEIGQLRAIIRQAADPKIIKLK